MNKIKLVKAEIERLKNELIQEVEKGCKSEFDEGRISAFEDMITFIDSLGEEPVSNDLDSFAKEYSFNIPSDIYNLLPKEKQSSWVREIENAVKAGAQWQKEHLLKPADGDNLPKIDREVIALLSNGKVVYAHRPQEYWDGKNIATGEVTRHYPIKYDKGGWNIPDVKFWLDCELS